MSNQPETSTYRMQGEITMLSPLAHGGERIGTTTHLAEEIVLDECGRPVEAFVYSGNAFKGVMRDAGTKYLLDRLGIKLPKAAFYMFFSGGRMDGKQSYDFELAKRMREMFPLISIIGTSAKSQNLYGKLKVGQMYPIVREFRRILPAKYKDSDLPSWREWTFEKSLTRKDDEKDDRLRAYLHEPGDAKLIEGPAKRTKDDGPQQMLFHVEALAAGSVLWQRIDLVWSTELELGAFVSCLAEWSHAPYLGSNSSRGFGLCEATWEIQCSRDADPQPFVSIGQDGAVLGPVAAEAKQKYDEFLLNLYERYIEGKQTEMKALLGVA